MLGWLSHSRFLQPVRCAEVKNYGSRTMLRQHYIAAALYCDKSNLVAISCAKCTILRQHYTATKSCHNIVLSQYNAWTKNYFRYRHDETSPIYTDPIDEREYCYEILSKEFPQKKQENRETTSSSGSWEYRKYLIAFNLLSKNEIYLFSFIVQ